MNLAAFALRKRTLMVVLIILFTGAGIISYQRIGRLEDPTFTIKTALVSTLYPGASPSEVEQEVSDVIEEAIQEMGQVKEIYSTSREGLSVVYVDVKDTYTHEQLPQIWDELRKKIADSQPLLPPGAGPSVVNDDFGDVYGLFFAITGKNKTYAELKDYADQLKTELLLCEDVAKIEFWGTQQEVLYAEFDRAKLSELGITPEQIYGTLQSQNLVERSGKVEIDGEYVRITPTGEFQSVEAIEDLLIGGADGLVKLSDICEVRRGYIDPPRNMMRFNGQKAIGFGISTVDGGNVVDMGKAVADKLNALKSERPDGIRLHRIYYQSEIVTEAVNTFLLNLAEAVAIVIVLLMLFMGWQSGLLIGVILLMTILCTFLGMYVMDINLQKISLGALILALGMLVDNAIVVADGILVKVERGERREEAAVDIVRAAGMPLLGATAVAILAFTAIGFAPGSVGEFCRSLFYVMALSLSISWVLAVTVTPLFCVWFLKIPKTEEGFDPYSRPMYRKYRRFLHTAIKYRWLTLAAAGLALAGGLHFMGKVSQSFFPDSTKPYFYVNFWKPEGTHIDKTSEDMRVIEKYISSLDGIENVSTFVGEGTLRFILSYEYQTPNSSYGQFLVEVDDYKKIGIYQQKVKKYLVDNFPNSDPMVQKIGTGPTVPYKIEARFRGKDPKVLHRLAGKAVEVMRETPGAKNIRKDWRQRVNVIRPEFSESQAHRIGVSRSDLANSLQWNFNGLRVGLYREKDELIPIISRPPEDQRVSAENIEKVQVWSSNAQAYFPIRQVVTEMKPEWEWPIIERFNRQKSVKAQCNAVGNAEALRQEIAQKIEGFNLPPGYSLEWQGEYDSTQEAQDPLKKVFPICMLGMFIVVVWLFNSVKKPLIIFLALPLSIIGIGTGLYLMNVPFGFMAILGFLGLSGMLIKNAIVLIDQIQLDLNSGKEPYKAVLDSSVSRLRPVLMAAGTTILGMAPLVPQPLYSGMAATIMSGLFAATFLTLILVPVEYCIFYRIKTDESKL
ncbi:efflux RND transporter permease subunit [Sedimentisphaera salicampi]|uniref:efflux RND transporter permease subunit n=1 Tax=Sedimentisphaera salicampi TaxID=1941349 RepID=UPI000B9C67A0|nr:efflux RND transporter permease subunit [Sedimentisphaera salicampi]OXU15052.1 Cation efflux system protein CzcA [Sedimentisphaera salicampi]